MFERGCRGNSIRRFQPVCVTLCVISVWDTSKIQTLSGIMGRRAIQRIFPGQSVTLAGRFGAC